MLDARCQAGMPGPGRAETGGGPRASGTPRSALTAGDYATGSIRGFAALFSDIGARLGSRARSRGHTTRPSRWAREPRLASDRGGPTRPARDRPALLELDGGPGLLEV